MASFRTLALFLGPGAGGGGLRPDCQCGGDAAAGSSAGLLSVCAGQSREEAPGALLIQFV